MFLTNRDTLTSFVGVDGVVRAAALRGFDVLVRELGGDPDSLLRSSGLDPESMSDPESMVALDAVARLLESAARQTDTRTLGLRLGDLQDPAMLGVLAVAIQHAATVGDAVLTASRYLFVHSPSYELALENPSLQLPHCATLRFDVTFEGVVPQRQLIDGCLSSMHHIMQALLPEPIRLQGVSLPHTPTGRSADYQAHFGAQVFFEQPYAGFHVDRAVLGMGMGSVRPFLRDQAIAYIAAQHPAAGRSVSDRVRSALKSTIGANRGTKAELAALLQLHPRTLQRRLAAEHTSFERLRDEVYAAATLRLLRESAIPLSQAAAALGFSEHSAMTRSVRRWFAVTPTQLRRASSA